MPWQWWQNSWPLAEALIEKPRFQIVNSSDKTATTSRAWESHE